MEECEGQRETVAWRVSEKSALALRAVSRHHWQASHYAPQSRPQGHEHPWMPGVRLGRNGSLGETTEHNKQFEMCGVRGAD